MLILETCWASGISTQKNSAILATHKCRLETVSCISPLPLPFSLSHDCLYQSWSMTGFLTISTPPCWHVCVMSFVHTCNCFSYWLLAQENKRLSAYHWGGSGGGCPDPTQQVNSLILYTYHIGKCLCILGKSQPNCIAFAFHIPKHSGLSRVTVGSWVAPTSRIPGLKCFLRSKAPSTQGAPGGSVCTGKGASSQEKW